jgi:hypothetical protein
VFRRHSLDIYCYMMRSFAKSIRRVQSAHTVIITPNLDSYSRKNWGEDSLQQGLELWEA